MIELRPAETDVDLEAWRRVRIAVLPNERTGSVEELRRGAGPDQLYLLALLDGEVVGSGAGGRSDTGGGSVTPRVLPPFRRRGVGTAILWALADHVTALGHDTTGSMVDNEGSLAFAQRFGFHERMRQIEQVRVVAAVEKPPAVPDGIEIVALAGRDDLAGRVYDELAREALRDLATDRPIQITSEIWAREWLPSVDGCFLALADGEIVGMAGLIGDVDHPARAENALTAVRRDRRRRGLARALKLQAIHWASTHGIREIYTWTQTGNEAMQALNRSLGYVDRAVSINLRAPLPLVRSR